jgi:hypothetical protein
MNEEPIWENNPWNWTPTQKDIEWTGAVLRNIEENLAKGDKPKVNVGIQHSEARFVFFKGKKTYEAQNVKPSDFVAFCFMCIIHDHFGYEAELIIADMRKPIPPKFWENN